MSRSIVTGTPVAENGAHSMEKFPATGQPSGVSTCGSTVDTTITALVRSAAATMPW